MSVACGTRGDVREEGRLCSVESGECLGAAALVLPSQHRGERGRYRGGEAALAAGFLEPGMEMTTKPFAAEAFGAKVKALIRRNESLGYSPQL